MKAYIIIVAITFAVLIIGILCAMLRASAKYGNKYTNRKHNISAANNCKTTPQEDIEISEKNNYYSQNG